MSNDPNKLAWKGIPAPYRVELPARRHGGINNYRCVVYRISDTVGTYQTIADVYGDGLQQCEAQANFISAAPEAVEFIADFLMEFDKIAGITPEIAALIERGEQIIKKAYNF